MPCQRPQVRATLAVEVRLTLLERPDLRGAAARAALHARLVPSRRVRRAEVDAGGKQAARAVGRALM